MRKGDDITPWCVDAPSITTILFNTQTNPAYKRQQAVVQPRGRGRDFRGQGRGARGRGRYDSRHQDKRPATKQDICRKYNNNRCTFANCSRRHVCLVCESPMHKEPKCPSKTH